MEQARLPSWRRTNGLRLPLDAAGLARGLGLARAGVARRVAGLGRECWDTTRVAKGGVVITASVVDVEGR